MIRKRELFKIFTGCTLLYKTAWYKSLFATERGEVYPDNVWYRNHDERNFNIVNLGSSSAKWAFDWDAVGVKGMNWAQQPQSLEEDFNLLKHFHSILRAGGYVIVTIMPFSSLGRSAGMLDALRYLQIDTHAPIEPAFYKEARRHAEFPILFKKTAIKALIRYFLHREKSYANPNTESCRNLMNGEQLEADANMWVDGWKKQFNIESFNDPLTVENRRKRENRRELMQNIIDFCTERGYKPVFTILPVTKHLSAHFTKTFTETYIYSFLREIGRDVPIFDYSNDEELCSDDLYFNSFFLNKRGRELMTRRVVADLHLPTH